MSPRDGNKKPQRGFTMIVVMFLLAVLVSLGGYMVTIAGTAHQSSVLSLVGERAYFAARTGIEYALYDIDNNNGAALGCGGAGATLALSGGATAGFSVAISCTRQNVTEGAAVYGVWQLTSTATRATPGSLDYARRTLTATVAR